MQRVMRASPPPSRPHRLANDRSRRARQYSQHMNRFQLATTLSPAQCVSRLAAAMDVEPTLRRPFAGMSGAKQVVGRITEQSLRLRKRIQYHNSFQSRLTATIEPAPDGTMISARVAMERGARVFMAFWIAGTLVSGCPFLLAAARSVPATAHEWMGVLVPISMPVFGALLVGFGRYLARDEARFLKEFLIQTLDAQVASESP